MFYCLVALPCLCEIGEACAFQDIKLVQPCSCVCPFGYFVLFNDFSIHYYG
eukprot:m.364283 g.364283  ORF g.364283 m.364283 type:complete len:51 (+) comp26341_c0_seq1:66-218(+)